MDECRWREGWLEGAAKGMGCCKACLYQDVSACKRVVPSSTCVWLRVSLGVGQAFDSLGMSNCGLWLRSLCSIINQYLYF